MSPVRSFVFVLLSLCPAVAAAGPPYVTDDPEPTERGHWELYLFGSAEGARRDWEGAAGVDLNYGIVENVQLTATLPVDFAHASGRTRAGAGDVELGVKYRLLHDEAAGFDVAVFPRIILPTARHGFGTGRASVLLPVWAEKDFGPWSLFGGAGYTVNPGAGDRDFWQGGIALTRTVSERLSVGGEATVEGPDEAGGRGKSGLGLGAIYKLGGPFALLVSGGPVKAHHGPTGWRTYAALGLSF